MPKYNCSKADPCLYFKWIGNELVLWTTWIDDCFILENPELVEEAKAGMKQHFDCDDVGELNEYVGCKVKHNKDKGWIQLTQPVLLQSFQDEFELPEGEASQTPAVPGQVLQKTSKDVMIPDQEQTIYHS